ncbi:hypothetical protein [Neobacillus niacini]|uniref:hypothetical protein n=1 Tax=Neobacillus niacini TaxID=86668 RepID=UPI002FFD6EAA
MIKAMPMIKKVIAFVSIPMLTRITIYKIFKKWEEEGLLSVENRKISIIKPDILKQYPGSLFSTNGIE